MSILFLIFLLNFPRPPLATFASELEEEMATIRNITAEVRELYGFLNLSALTVREIYVYYIELRVTDDDEEQPTGAGTSLVMSLFNQIASRKFDFNREHIMYINQTLPQVLIMRDMKRRHILLRLMVVGNVFHLGLELKNGHVTTVVHNGVLPLLHLFNLMNVLNCVIVSSPFVSSTNVVTGIDLFNYVHAINYVQLDSANDLPCGELELKFWINLQGSD
jgi:hypothetical protein